MTLSKNDYCFINEEMKGTKWNHMLPLLLTTITDELLFCHWRSGLVTQVKSRAVVTPNYTTPDNAAHSSIEVPQQNGGVTSWGTFQ